MSEWKYRRIFGVTTKRCKVHDGDDDDGKYVVFNEIGIYQIIIAIMRPSLEYVNMLGVLALVRYLLKNEIRRDIFIYDFFIFHIYFGDHFCICHLCSVSHFN